MFFLVQLLAEFCKIFGNVFFIEHHQATASGIASDMKKTRI